MRTILLLMLGLLAACAGDRTCQLDPVATLPVRLLGRVPVVTAEINGRPATLVLDTGSDATVLTRAAARRLGVTPDGPARSVGAAGGQASISPAHIERLGLGPITLPNVRAALADAPAPPLDGLIGLNVLNGYELDLDVPNGRATLYRFRPCPAALPGWAGPTVRLPVQMQAGSGHLFVAVTLDDEPLRGMLDTGASNTVMSVQTAEDVRVGQRQLQQLPGARSQALNPGGLAIRTRRFRSMRVGTDVMENPVLAIGDLPPFAGDLLIGSDYLATRRVWFSFLLGAVFVPGSAPPGR